MLPIVAFALLVRFQSQADILPDTVPAHRLTDLIKAFNSKDEAEIDAMVAKDFSKAALKATPKDDWVANIRELSFKLAPISVTNVVRSNATTIVVDIHTNSSDPLGIRLEVESEDPNGIDSVKLAAPSELVASKLAGKYSSWKELDQLVEAVRSDNKLPALVLGYAIGDGPPQLAAAGLKATTNQAEIITEKNRLPIGAIGKAMTATLIARLVDMNKLAWTETLETALPEVKMQDAYKTITIEQLIQGTASLPGDNAVPIADRDALIAKAETPTDMRKAYVANILTRDPDASLAGNTAYVLLGYIAERTIHQPYEYLMDRYVFQPMKITSVLIAPLHSESQAGSLGYVQLHVQGDFGYAPFDVPPSNFDTILAPAGFGVTCDASDLLKFATFHLKGLQGDAKILTADSYKKLHTPAQTAGIDKSVAGWNVNPGFAGEPCLWQKAGDGSYYADLAIFPKGNLAIVALTNAGTLRQPAPTLQALLAIRDKLEHKD